MNSREIRSLQEAYLEVISNSNELSEMSYKKLPVGKMMRKVEYRAEREADTRADMEREADDPHSILNYDRARREHERAERNKEKSNTMMNVADTHSKKEAKAKSKYRKEEVDLYDIILSHLLDEGYANTLESAEAIMVNMSEDWREDIVEGYKRMTKKKIDRMERQMDEKDKKMYNIRQGERYQYPVEPKPEDYQNLERQIDTIAHVRDDFTGMNKGERRLGIKPKYGPAISKAKEKQNRERGQNRENRPR